MKRLQKKLQKLEQLFLLQSVLKIMLSALV